MPTSTPEMIERMLSWGNSLDVIADESGVDVDLLQLVLDTPSSHVRPQGVKAGLRVAYENLKPLSHCWLDSAPLLRHHRRILDACGGDPTVRRRIERARERGRVSYALADDMLCRIGLPVELVYGTVTP